MYGPKSTATFPASSKLPVTMVTGRAADRDKISPKLPVQNQCDDRDETNDDEPGISKPTTASSYDDDGWWFQNRRRHRAISEPTMAATKSKAMASSFEEKEWALGILVFFFNYIFYWKNGILGILKYYWGQNWKFKKWEIDSHLPWESISYSLSQIVMGLTILILFILQNKCVNYFDFRFRFLNSVSKRTTNINHNEK